MKYLFDRNLSPYLAEAIGALCTPDSISVVHLDKKFPKNTPDVAWITALGDEGGWVIISQDRFTKNQAEREALKATGILTFILTKQWMPLKAWDKAFHLVRWWPRIMEASTLMSKGAYFVPVKMSGKGKLEPVSL